MDLALIGDVQIAIPPQASFSGPREFFSNPSALLNDSQLAIPHEATDSIDWQSQPLQGPAGSSLNTSDPGPAPSDSAFPTIVTPAQILAAMQPHIQRLAEIDAIDRQIAQLAKFTAGDRLAFNERWKKRAALIRYRDTLERESIAEGRRIVALPPTLRGNIHNPSPIPSSLQQLVARGQQVVEAYVHPDLLPTVNYVPLPPGNKAGYHRGLIDIAIDAPTLSVVHEVAHGLDQEHSDVLATCRDFLTERAAGQPPRPLSELDPEGIYEANEIAFEDEWRKRGGDAYSGRYYARPGESDPQRAKATELLTMGLERLHKNPVLFAKTDPGYFHFVIQTIRNR